MNNDLTVLTKPKDLAEGMALAKMISESSFVPKSFNGKPGDVLLAIQMGGELGLNMMQSLQNIAVINGKPSIYAVQLLFEIVSG